MTVSQLIAILQKLDPNATVVAPFSSNASEINVEKVGGAVLRQQSPFAGAVQLSRTRPDFTNSENGYVSSTDQAPDAVDEDILTL